MKLLDLFCGAGGSAMGYYQAGFEIVGIDIKRQNNYPFEFYFGDVFDLDPDFINSFDVIHASPPCQKWTVLRRANPGHIYDDAITPTREILQESNKPYIIENVPKAPLQDPIMLCGSMFGLGCFSGNGKDSPRMYRQLRRHRLFETNFYIPELQCEHAFESIGVYGGGPQGRYTFNNGSKKYNYRRGGYQGTQQEKAEAMEIEWMNRNELNQAVPPAYTRYIGRYLKTAIETGRIKTNLLQDM